MTRQRRNAGRLTGDILYRMEFHPSKFAPGVPDAHGFRRAVDARQHESAITVKRLYPNKSQRLTPQPGDQIDVGSMLHIGGESDFCQRITFTPARSRRRDRSSRP